MEQRLPAHVEVSGLIRAVETAGGFAAVLSKGEREAGTIMVVCRENGVPARAFERMPRPDGTRAWSRSRVEDREDPAEFADYLDRRAKQDDDLWIVELDVANGERFLGLEAG